MMLGIVLHSAAVFSTHEYWLVSYERTSIYFDWLISTIHTFRMPLFFMIAGFFALMLLQRYKTRKFITNRTNRIVVPFISAFLLLNPFQNLLMSMYYQQLEAPKNYFIEYSISHLWFLVNLMGYCILLWLGIMVMRSLRIKVKILRLPKQAFLAAVLIFPIFNISVLAAGNLGVHIYEDLVLLGQPVTFMYYLAFFLFGAVIFLYKPWVELIETNRFIYLSLTIAALLVMGSLFEMIPAEPEGIFLKIGREYLETISILLICLFLWSFFARLLKASSKVMKYLSEASYTVYLFHHILVVAFVILINLNGINAHPAILFTCLVALVFISSLAIHQFVIMRVSRLRFMFNGR
ncbi:acyltransferase family protein [Glaciecola sp. XM2]|nr:acyltransferase family protein [Glaciecola sp. XM2]